MGDGIKSLPKSGYTVSDVCTELLFAASQRAAQGTRICAVRVKALFGWWGQAVSCLCACHDILVPLSVTCNSPVFPGAPGFWWVLHRLLPVAMWLARGWRGSVSAKLLRHLGLCPSL